MAESRLESWQRTEGYQRALSFAMTWHGEQVDKAGRHYGEHLVDTVHKLLEYFPDSTEEDVQTALLHDVLEDTRCTVQDIAENFGLTVARNVAMLSRENGTPYLDFIQGIASSGITPVIRVKLADNRSNSDESRAFPGSEEMVATRYAPARRILESALEPT